MTEEAERLHRWANALFAARALGLFLCEMGDNEYCLADGETGEVIAPLEGELTIEEIEVVIGELGETKNVG